VESPRDNRLSDLDRARIGWLPSLARFLALWAAWITQLRGRRMHVMTPAPWPARASDSGSANPRHISLPQEPLPIRIGAQTVRLADQLVSQGNESLEAKGPNSSAPATDIATDAMVDASPPPPSSPPPGVSAPVQTSEESSHANRSAERPAGEATLELQEAAPSAADHEAVPDPPTRRWGRTKRDLHVFSERAGVSGFASVPRAVISQENIVLCRTHLAATAIDCARATGPTRSSRLTRRGRPGRRATRAHTSPVVQKSPPPHSLHRSPLQPGSAGF
jgi:hypothetical protein